MTKDEVKNILESKPAIHLLCYGSIQEAVKLSKNLYAVPLFSVGQISQSQYVAQFVHEIGGSVDHSQLDLLKDQGRQALPAICITNTGHIDTSPELMEESAKLQFRHGCRVLSWMSGDAVTQFAVVTACVDKTYFRLIPPFSPRRRRMGPPTISDLSSNIEKMMAAAMKDEHFEFSLSLLYDANAESNEHFKIARYFNCLESLAYKYKKANEGRSRQAIRELLATVDISPIVSISIEGPCYDGDAVEIAGRVRDALLHGAIFRREDLNVQTRTMYDLYEKYPLHIANALRDFCEIMIAKSA